jgi:hypothetical protein
MVNDIIVVMLDIANDAFMLSVVILQLIGPVLSSKENEVL